jgi:hypothetical protein
LRPARHRLLTGMNRWDEAAQIKTFDSFLGKDSPKSTDALFCPFTPIFL